MEQTLPIESYVYNLLYEVMSPGPGQVLKVAAPLSILNVSPEHYTRTILVLYCKYGARTILVLHC